MASFSTSLYFEPPAFENVARYPNSKKMQWLHDRPMFRPSLAPLRNLCQFCPHPKIARKDVLNR